MKANKALKKITKIEVSLSDIAKRYSTNDAGVKEVLQEAKAAVVRVKAAVKASSANVAAPFAKRMSLLTPAPFRGRRRRP